LKLRVTIDGHEEQIGITPGEILEEDVLKPMA
jgi:hypothetical protein